MEHRTKKALAYSLKILLGIACFYFIYLKLSSIPNLKIQTKHLLNDSGIYLAFIGSILLMPINWGIESYKWKLTTTQIESISYKTALKSVFSGICAGNLAPGRAIEFLAKIVFFKIENRPSITILHFINGMFQMLVTILVGVTSVAYKLNSNQGSWVIYSIIAGGFLLLIFFIWAILNVAYIQQKIKFIKWFRNADDSRNIHFPKELIAQLITLSIIRYLVFTTQFYLIYHTLCPQTESFQVFISIAAYFMLTSVIPMISYIEPAIRAAIALFVFNNIEDNSVSVILASTFVWIINVVIPSIIGYIIIFREKIVFKP